MKRRIFNKSHGHNERRNNKIVWGKEKEESRISR